MGNVILKVIFNFAGVTSNTFRSVGGGVKIIFPVYVYFGKDRENFLAKMDILTYSSNTFLFLNL